MLILTVVSTNRVSLFSLQEFLRQVVRILGHICAAYTGIWTLKPSIVTLESEYYAHAPIAMGASIRISS